MRVLQPSDDRRYTLSAARDAGYRVLEQLDAEMALTVEPGDMPPARDDPPLDVPPPAREHAGRATPTPDGRTHLAR